MCRRPRGLAAGATGHARRADPARDPARGAARARPRTGRRRRTAAGGDRYRRRGSRRDHRTAPAMTKVLGRSILAISAALVTSVGLIALAVAAGAAAPARRALGFGFGGLRPGPQTALAIFAHNAMLLGGVILAAAVVHLAGRRKLASAQRPGADVLARSALDTLVALEAAFNVAILGAAIGAYGTRMLRAILPHGPLELL